MNCLLLEHGGDAIVLDAGVTFPARGMGVDLIHPSFAWLAERADRLRGIVLTHGHEDHVGALPYLLQRCPAPVYGPAYALAMVRRRLAEHPLGLEPELHAIEAGARFQLGSFELEPVRVTHSIPDCFAMVCRAGGRTLVHSGDFKIDLDPPDGHGFDLGRMAELGEAGVDCLLSDSTNIDTPGRTGKERAVASALEEAIAGAPHRVVAAVFASNAYRLGALLGIAERTGRRVCALGRSVQTHLRVAAELGHIEHPDRLLIQPNEVRDHPRAELLVIATGTQGEGAAALPKLSRDQHPDLQLERGDRVLLSSRIIPGCELAIHEMVDLLERMGVEVLTRATHPAIHCSGHAAREELRELIELLRPRSFLPVHGTYHHLIRHAALAQECGVEDTLVATNGDVVQLDDRGLRHSSSVAQGRVHVWRGEPLDDELLRERALMRELGFAVVAVALDAKGRRLGQPSIVCRGVLNVGDADPILEEAEHFVAAELDRGWDPREDDATIEDRARRSLRRFLGRRLGRKPLVSARVVAIE